MTRSPFTISGFGDEIADDPAEQLDVLASLDIHHLDLRGAWGRNVLDFDEDDVRRIEALLAEKGAQVAMIASPVGKSQITEPAAYERARLETAIRLARGVRDAADSDVLLLPRGRLRTPSAETRL